MTVPTARFQSRNARKLMIGCAAPISQITRATSVTALTTANFVSHADWSVASGDLEAAGQAGARDVWSLGIGAQVSSVKLFGHVAPLRAGYRWRQLPFLVPEPNPALPTRTVPLSEHAVSLGIGFLLAGGRANLDAALEGGSRTAGSVSERFTTMLVGVSVFP